MNHRILVMAFLENNFFAQNWKRLIFDGEYVMHILRLKFGINKIIPGW